MPTAREAWITTSRLPKGASYQQMLEFFGIPPYSAERLDANILKKRRDWHHKTNSGNPIGRGKAKEVVDLIHRVSEALKRGVTDNDGGGATAEIPDAVFETIGELWRIISEYVFADDYDRALQVARVAVSRWGMGADTASVFAWVIATGFNTGNLIHPTLLTEGAQAANLAIQQHPDEARNWESMVSLLMAAGRPVDAMAALSDAEQRLTSGMTARLYVMRVRAALNLGQQDEAMTAAVRAVREATADSDVLTAIRSETTDLLVTWLAQHLLPIRTPDALQRYVEMVDVAAWCSHGVPEAEDIVRTHRMWAANAGQRVFVGSWKLRSFLAVCTGFISLPIHNLVRSAPAWQVFAQGLDDDGKRGLSFAVVAGPGYVQRAHGLRLAVGLDDI